MFATKLVLPALLAGLLLGSGAATAADLTYDIGTITSVSGQAFNHYGDTPGTGFFDTLNFHVDTAGTLSVSAVSINLSHVFNIGQLTGNVWSGHHPDGENWYGEFNADNTVYSFMLPSAGDYHIDFAGVVSGDFGGSYATALTMLPVPEPETYTMFLAGIGLIGAIARRRLAA